MSKKISVLFICVLFVISASEFMPQTNSAKQEKTEAEKLAEKLARLKGEKVTILGTKPLQCLSASSDDKTSLFYSYEDKEREHRLPLNKYAGQTGVILEAKRVREVDIVIQLDKTVEKIVAEDDKGLGFHSELEAAKRLVGRSLWAKSEYNTITPTSDPCRYFSKDERLPLKKLQKVTVTRVEFGDYEQPIIFFARTDDGREGQVYPLHKKTYFDEKFHELKNYSGASYYSEEFLLDDPRKLHPTWSAAVWKLIENGEVAIGMTEEMVKLACVNSMVGGKLQEDGFVLSLSGSEISTIYKCSGKRFLIEKGKVTKYVYVQ